MSRSKTLTTAQLATVLGISKQAVVKRAEKETWAYMIGENRTKLFYGNKLPPKIQMRIRQYIYGVEDETIEEMVCRFEIRVPPEKLKDPKVASKIRMVCECLAVPIHVRKRRAKIRDIAESHGYNFSTAYRLMKRVKKGKWLIKPTKNYGSKIENLGITVRAWDKEAAHMAIEEIMANRRNHAEKLTLYERIRDRAEAEGLKCGSYESFLHLHKRIGKSLIHYRDKGVRGLREDIVPVIRRDHTAYRAMECLVGDQHKADYYCFDYNGDVATLELFCWLDFRTQMVWGAVSYKHYNRYTVGQALLNAVKWGLPSQVYTDWGKPEESKYTALLIEQLTGLGIKAKSIRHTRAKVRHPQAKPIESFFGRLDKNFRNNDIPGYCKRLKDSRESELQQKEIKEQIRAGRLPGIEEMVDRLFAVINKWNDHLFKNRGPDNGKSPRQIYNEEIRKNPVTTISDDVLDYIFLPIIRANGNGKPIKVQRSQVKIRHEYFKRILIYYSPELADFGGTEVFVRYNPFDPSRVWIFEQGTGRLICSAREWGMINPKNMDHVSARIEMQNRLVRQISEKYKLWLPAKSRKSHIPRIHPQEKEARQYKEDVKSGSRIRKPEIRVLRTLLEKDQEQLRVAGGPGYRSLSFENGRRLNAPRSLIALSIHDEIDEEE